MTTLHCPKGHTVKVAPKPTSDELRCPEHEVRLLTGMQARARKKPLKRSPMKRSKAISPASKVQRDKVRDLYCLVCGRDGSEVKIDPAHVWPRGLGGCDDPDCVVPICRRDHRLSEDGKIDLLPFLIAAGCWIELAHPTAVHEVSPTVLVEHLTGQRYVAVAESESPERKGASARG